MALIAWLLNGDLNNYGIGAVTVTNHGATLDNTCKTGKGYNFASNTYIDATIPSITGNFTVAWWEYSTNFNNGTMPWGIQMFNPFYNKCLNTGDGTDNPWYKPGTTTAIDDLSNSVWHHFAVTGNGNVNYLYIDGSLYGQSKIYKKLNSMALRFNGWPHDTKYKRNSKLCDWRLYNTCLSAEEIKEISRGMVLHYKMCQPERSENLLLGTNNEEVSSSKWWKNLGSGANISLDKIGPTEVKWTCITPSSQWNCLHRNLTLSKLSNTGTYTLSLEVKSSSGGSLRCNLQKSNGLNNLGLFGIWTIPANKWIRIVGTVTLNGGSWDSQQLYFSGSVLTTANSNCLFKNIKLETGTNPNPQWSPAPSDNPNWGTIEYDGSGFKNHGTVSGNVTLSADSPRYTGSYKFGTNNYITTTSTGNYIKSATFWAKDDGSVPRNGLVFRDQNSGLAFGIQSGNLITGAVGGPAGSSSVSVSVSDAKYTANTWHFFACVNDNGTQRLYMDGIQISTGTGTGNWSQGSPTNSLNVGGRAGSSYWPGYISDFKMYATVLSTTDVQELYKLGRV